MNSAIVQKRTNTNVWLLAGILFIGALAISNQSLWIDEANTALKAQQISLHDWWHEMLRTNGSDLQMPLYMIWIWACEKFFGSSEIALRAVNLFWFVPGLFALSRVVAKELRSFVFLTAAFSPFAWYYLDEARPYAMQIGASLFLTAAIIHWSKREFEFSKQETVWVCGFNATLVALCGASMLGMIWAAAAILVAIFLLPKKRLIKLWCDFIFIWLFAVILLAALGFYYLWTLKHGARASDVAATGWKNAVFAGYELFGFAGLGPGRLEIRDGGLQVFKPYLPQLILFAGMILMLFFFATRFMLRIFRPVKFIGLALILIAPAIFILAAGFFLHFRVLGRHFAPMFPIIIFLLAAGTASLWQNGRTGKFFVVIFFVFYLGSDFSLRFEARHARDDYRAAADRAKISLAGGETVWWNADANCAAYYQLPLTTSSLDADKALLIVNPQEEFFKNAALPQLVICSRPDIYDPVHSLANFLARAKFIKVGTVSAFVIWKNPSSR